MRLTVVGSGSAGNCYILESETEAIIIEAGVNIKKIKEAMNFNFSKLRGVLISHEHL